MDIIIIDNGSTYLPNLISFAKADGKNTVKTVKYNLINFKDVERSDFIVLSGGHDVPVWTNPENYQIEMDLIRSSSKPILGICMGFEIIADAFGSELERMSKKESGILEIYAISPHLIPTSLKSVKVIEHHQWRVKKLGPNLIALAESIDGIEIIMHKNKPIVGLQFHPELDPTINFQQLVDDLFG